MQVRYQTAPTAREEETLSPAQFTPGCPAAPLPPGRRERSSLQLSVVTPTESPPDGATVNPLPDLEAHLTRIAEQGYTILPDAIEPDLVDEIDEALLKLEHDLGTVPADNLFEGVRTMRVYNLLVHGPTFEKIPRPPQRAPRRGGGARSGPLDFVALLHRHRAR